MKPQWLSAALGTLIGRYRDRAMSFVDQALLGLSALAINIILARYLSVLTFASVSMMMGAYYFVFNVHRSAIVLPYILESSAITKDDNCQRSWWTANVVFLSVATASLALFAFVLRIFVAGTPAFAWISDAAFYLLLTTPPLLAFEYGRRVLYQQERMTAVTSISATYLTAGIAAAALGSCLGSENIASLAFAAAGMSGFIVFLCIARPKGSTLSSAWAIWTPHAKFAAWQSATSIPYNLYAVAPVVLIGLFAGPTSAAIFWAARTVVSPAFSMVSAVDSIDKPRAARAMASAGVPGLHSSISETRKLLLVLAGGYLAAVAIFAPAVLDLAFGPRYTEHSTAVRILALSFLCMCLNQPVETMLIVLRRVRPLFYVRSAAAIAVTLGIWVGERTLGTYGAIWAIALVQLGVLLILSIIEISIKRLEIRGKPNFTEPTSHS